MYNKKVLIDSLKNLGSAKAPTKQKDNIYINKDTLSPFVSSEGFKQGPPPPGTNYRIPGNTLYNPTPYSIDAVSDNGIRKTLKPYDTKNIHFPGANHVDEYAQMRSGGNKHNHVVVKPSEIGGADKGLFSNQDFRKDQLIGLAHKNGQPVGHIGKMHNHSDEPNMYSIKKGNQRYVYAKRDIQPGEELTTDYRQQPELEQPEDFMRNGGMTPQKAGLREIPTGRFKQGGALLNKTMTCGNCGW